MGIKGRPFEGVDDPRIPRGVRQRRTAEQLQAWVDAENARWAVVAVCEEHFDAAGNVVPHLLAAEEVEPHRLSHLKTVRARQIIGMLMDATRTTPEALSEIRAYLNGLP